MDEYVPTIPFIRERPHVFSSRRVLDRGLMTYFKQREEEGETQMRTLSARSQRLRSLASSYMDLSPSERRRIPTSLMHGYQFDERSRELYSFDENAVYKVEVTTMGKLRILNKIRDLTDVDKRHVFDDPFRYKVISPFRVISLVEVLNNANGMRQVNGEGVAGDNFAQPANDNQFPPGNGDGGFGPDQFPPGNGDWDNQGYPSPPGSNQSQPFHNVFHPVEPLRAEVYNSQNNAYNNNQMAYDLPDDDEPYPELNSAELEEDANEVVEFAEAERMARAYEDAGVEFPKEFKLEQYRKRLERMKELCQTVEQTSPDVIAATLPKIYGPAVEIVEEAKTSSKEEREEIKESLHELIDEVDDKLDDADSEIKELHESLAQLSLDIATDQDQGKVEWDKTNVANQMKVVEDKVNETNERNAQILSGSSGQEVNPVKVEVKVDPMPGASPSEFMKGVSKANDELIGSQEVTNDYYASFATDENERKLFEDKNNVLNRSRKVHYIIGKIPMFPQHPPSPRPGLIVPDSLRALRGTQSVPAGDNPPLPQKSRGSRYGLNAEDLRRMNATQVPTTPLGNRSKRIITTRPQTIVPNAQQGQTQVPTPAAPVQRGRVFPRQTQVPTPAAPVETVQEPVVNKPKRGRRKTSPPTPIIFDGSHVIVDEARLLEMSKSVKGLRAAPLSYEQYKSYLDGMGLKEYFDEKGECKYFYYRYQKLSNMVPENIRISNNRSVPIPETIDDDLKNKINIAISLYLFKPLISASREPLNQCRNNFLALVALLNENGYLIEEYEEEERAIFINEVRIGKLMEEFEKGTQSKVSSFFVKLRKQEYKIDKDDSSEVALNFYKDIDDYIRQFKLVPENEGTETYREYLHTIAMMTLAKFEVNDERQNQSNQNNDNPSPSLSPTSEELKRWAEEEFGIVI